MIHLSFRDMYELYKNHTSKYLPLNEYHKMVDPGEQKREIRLLKETIHFERFFFVINLHTLELENINGVAKWLGYSDNDFTILKFLQIIHPSHLQAHYITASEIISGLMNGDWKVEFMKHRYITKIALRHNNGEYILFKRLASVFQYDKDHKLLEYLNEFTMVGEFREESYVIEANNDDGSKLIWLQDVLVRVRRAFEEKNHFSFQELRILRKFAYLPKVSASQIATSFKIKDSTVITHKKRILQKAEQIFYKKFSTVKQLADFLKEQGLI